MNLGPMKIYYLDHGSYLGENFNINMQNLEFNETAKSGFELKGQFNMGCQWRAICVWV